MTGLLIRYPHNVIPLSVSPETVLTLFQDSLSRAAPVSGGIGKLLLERMGWKEGTGLGKGNAGNVEPLQLDFKLDRKGCVREGWTWSKAKASGSIILDLAILVLRQLLWLQCIKRY